MEKINAGWFALGMGVGYILIALLIWVASKMPLLAEIILLILAIMSIVIIIAITHRGNNGK